MQPRRPPPSFPRASSGNIARLTIAQALAGANAVVVYATGSIVGNMLAPDKALATLPLSIFVVGMAACILPAGAIARRHGRRAAFLAGTGCGVLVGLLAALAVVLGSFWLFCLGTFFGGAYAAVVLSFRFAAADGVSPERRARALSFVMGGGVLAGVVGPQLVTHTMYLWPAHMFAATFIVRPSRRRRRSCCWACGCPCPARPRRPAAGRWRSSRASRASSPRWSAAPSLPADELPDDGRPLAMHLCGHSQEDANLGLQWHVIAMYAPSFFTGRLIMRFGAGRMVSAGLALTGISAAIGLMGLDVAHFWVTLVLLGLGWNFGFVGASALVLECHRPEERTKVQSLNDFIIFGIMAVGSFASGGLLAAYDWRTVLWVSFIPLALAVVALCRSARAARGVTPWRACHPKRSRQAG